MTRLAKIDEPMTVEEFLAFTETRPDEERWELIEGEPIMNAAPVYPHQKIVSNLIVELSLVARRSTASWSVVPGINVRLSEISSPVPDVMIRPNDDLRGNICDDMIVAFEVLSPSTARRDLRWKRKAYAELPSLEHYVVIAPDTLDILVYDRATGFAERRLGDVKATLDLAAIGVSLPVADIYRDMSVGGRS